MNFIVTHWWLWLILLVIVTIFCGYIMGRQLKRGTGISRRDFNSRTTAPSDSFFNNFGFLVFAGLLSSAAGTLLLISIIVNLLEYLAK